MPRVGCWTASPRRTARTGKYLEAATGQPNRHLLSMARPGLRLELRAALHEAAETARPAWRRHLILDLGEQAQLVDLVVEPVAPDGAGSGPLFLVVFKDASRPFEPAPAEAAPAAQ